MEGGSQNAIKFTSFSILFRGAKIENPDTLGGPDVRHPRHPTGDAEGGTLDDQVVDAAEYAETITAFNVRVGHATDIAGLLFHANDRWRVGKLVEYSGCDVDAIGNRDCCRS